MYLFTKIIYELTFTALKIYMFLFKIIKMAYTIYTLYPVFLKSDVNYKPNSLALKL